MKREILVGLTGKSGKKVIEKIDEAEKFKIKRATLFLEMLSKDERKKVYDYLLKSKIRSIPLVHIRNDMTKDELRFLIENFKSRYLTIHESSFKYLPKWRGFHKNLFLEMNWDSKVPKIVDIKKIGGFCIDLSHFKAGEKKWAKDFIYVMDKSEHHKYFACNHLNGYDPKGNNDMHTVKSLKDFSYLKTLPKFVFGNCIALEMFNPIKQQLRYKKYLTKLLNSLF